MCGTLPVPRESGPHVHDRNGGSVAWNFATCFEAIVDTQPDELAVVQGDRRYSWREFDDRAARISTALTDFGLGPDSKVAFYLHNGSEYLETTYAAFKSRAAHVNVNYRYVEDELQYLLDNSDAEAVFFNGYLGDRIAAVRDRLPKLKALVQVDDGTPLLDGALAYEDVVASHEPAARIERSNDDLYILYTGGTTGSPKGVMWRMEDFYFALVPAVYAIAGQVPPAEAEATGEVVAKVREAGQIPVHLPASPLMHGTGFMTSMQALMQGGAIVLLESRTFNADELWRAVQNEAVTQMAIVGDAFAKPMVRALEDAETRNDPYDLSSVRAIISSGVMWTAEVKEALMKRGTFVCLDSLGSSEGVGFAYQVDTPAAKPKTARFTISDSCRVLTEEGREVTPGSGETGLLSLGGPIPLGYYKDERKTAETFRTFGGNRYSVPGDWARVETDGTITLLGRGSVSINSGGEKIYPEEVEEALKSHAAVADAIVVGVPDERFGEAVTAVVALRPGERASSDELAEATKGRLANFKRPRRVVVVDEVRRGPNGKADYRWAKEVAAESA
jgi:3-oxocholest-4-en-26-oate---CoA ligase